MTGDVDAALLLLFAVMFQIFVGLSLGRILKAGSESLQALSTVEEDPSPLDIQVFGESFRAPLPRIDYGAYHQKNRDAEALCLVARKTSFESKKIDLVCE